MLGRALGIRHWWFDWTIQGWINVTDVLWMPDSVESIGNQSLNVGCFMNATLTCNVTLKAGHPKADANSAEVKAPEEPKPGQGCPDPEVHDSNICRFTETGVPLNHLFMDGFSTINHPFWDTSILGNLHLASYSPCLLGRICIPSPGTHQEDIQVNLLGMRNLVTRIDPKKERSQRKWQIQSLKRTGWFHYVLFHYVLKTPWILVPRSPNNIL